MYKRQKGSQRKNKKLKTKRMMQAISEEKIITHPMMSILVASLSFSADVSILMLQAATLIIITTQASILLATLTIRTAIAIVVDTVIQVAQMDTISSLATRKMAHKTHHPTASFRIQQAFLPEEAAVVALDPSSHLFLREESSLLWTTRPWASSIHTHTSTSTVITRSERRSL